MEDATKAKTKGLEKLEFLTDKAKRLVFQLQADEEKLSSLRTRINETRGKRKELVDLSNELRTKLTVLQDDKDKVDERIGKLLSALSELTID